MEINEYLLDQKQIFRDLLAATVLELDRYPDIIKGDLVFGANETAFSFRNCGRGFLPGVIARAILPERDGENADGHMSDLYPMEALLKAEMLEFHSFHDGRATALKCEKGELVEENLVEEIFLHPRSHAAKQLIIEGKDPDEWDASDALGKVTPILHEDRRIRIVFGTQSSFEPVIANMILTFGVAVNILRADTKDVGGVARGEMILGLPEDRELQENIIAYLKDRGLAVEEVEGVSNYA